MTIVAGDILRTSVNFKLPDDTLYQNIYHHKRTGVGILSDAAHMSAIEDWVKEAYDELIGQVGINTDPTLSTVDKVEWSGSQWLVVENIGTFIPDVTYVTAGDVMPNQLSPYALFKTARPSTVGRKFFFPMMEGSFTAGVIASAVVTVIATMTTVLVNDITIEVLNYLVPGVVRTGFDAWYPFTVAIVQNIAGTQRRRRRGAGA